MELINLKMDSADFKSVAFLAKFGHKLPLFPLLGLGMCESVGKNNC